MDRHISSSLNHFEWKSLYREIPSLAPLLYLRKNFNFRKRDPNESHPFIVFTPSLLYTYTYYIYIHTYLKSFGETLIPRWSLFTWHSSCADLLSHEKMKDKMNLQKLTRNPYQLLLRFEFHWVQSDLQILWRNFKAAVYTYSSKTW